MSAATFETGARYRVRFRVPQFIEPRLIVAALQRDISNVALSKVVRGVVTVEATWRGSRRVVDSEYLLSSERLQS